MKYPVVALLGVQLAALGCGGGDPPTQPTPQTRTFESTFGGSVPGHASQCFDFAQGASGEAFAQVGIRVPLELGAGRCGQSRTVIARSETGEVTATLPSGASFLRIENPGDGRLDYQIRLRYIMVF